MKITPEELAEYNKNPLAYDATLRKKYNIPEDRYYSVSQYPEKCAGNLYVDMTRNRIIHKKKISKSDQS